MQRIAAGMIVALGLLGLGAGTAQAAERWSSPSGGGTACSEADRCSLDTAIGGAAANDEVIVGLGTYSAGALSNSAAGLTVRGESSAVPPQIDGRIVLPGQDSTLRDLRITGSGGFAMAAATTIERVVARSTDAEAGCQPGARLLDSVCTSADGAGVERVGITEGTVDLTLRNVTAVGGARGIHIGTFSASTTTVDVRARNVIAEATGTPGNDIELERTIFAGGTTVNLTLDIAHSNFGAVAQTSQFGSGPGGTTVTKGPGNIEGPAPAFRGVNDFRVAAGAATIDAGDATGLDAGQDVRGLPRMLGAGADMGAYEDATPANLAVPAVGGVAQQGATLTLDQGTWSPARVVTLSPRWQRCAADGGDCADVPGATGTSYQLGAADLGRRIRAIVTGTTVDGSASGESAPTAVVTAPPAPPGTPPPGPSGDAPAPDRTAPRISAGRISPARFTARRPGRATFRLSEAATLRFQVERRSGRRWRALGRASTRRAPAGRATIRLPRSLPAGRYRLVITARDAAGNRSAPVRLAFRVRF